MTSPVPTSWGAVYDHRGKTLKGKSGQQTDAENADCSQAGRKLMWVLASLLRTRLAGAGQMESFPGLLAKSLRNLSVIKGACLEGGTRASLPRALLRAAHGGPH